MNKMSLLLIALLLSGCEKPMPFESAEALAEKPERLKELQRQCRDDWDKLGNAQCHAVTEAERKRFMGQGTPYTPYPVKGF
ncbi:EexN family lipoprotein [Pseudomonas sp. B1-22]|uniref:EexN family lipoprotein n=1 Tax=Pseudomonas sp. B1-22 TaxID=3141456 RepID=UPI003D27D97B